jgi:hypothetical protein
MLIRRFSFVVILLSASAAAHVACATTNGDIPDPTYDASPIDAANNPDPAGGRKDGSVGGDDGGTDATKDAPSSPDAKADADAGPAFDVKINELFVDNALIGDGAEYVELRGTPGVPVDDLKLRLLATDGHVIAEIDVANGPGDVIQPNGTWCVGGNSTFKLGVVGDHVDKEVSIVIWGLDNDRGAVQLVRGAARDLIDVVGYDTNVPGSATPAPPSPPTTTVEGKVATVPSVAKKAFGRKAAAVDTGDNSVDFCQMTPTPGKPQAACD